LEVTNTLLMGERRKRCTPADSAHFMGILSSLAIEVDRETGSRAFSEALALSRTHALTQYDAAYLELAMRNKIPLATLDAELRKAAKKVGVECWPQRI
jgi:predicted nucleic acid-binding protein